MRKCVPSRGRFPRYKRVADTSVAMLARASSSGWAPFIESGGRTRMTRRRK